MTVGQEHTDKQLACSSAVQDSSVRVVIADDHPLTAAALRTYVNSAPDMVCVGEARDGQTVVRICQQLCPDVVIMDLHMPRMDGISATRAIREESPGTAVLAVTAFSAERHIIPALRAGAGGYIVKNAEPEQILDAVRQVREGSVPFSPAVAHRLMLAVKNSPSQVAAALERFPDAPQVPNRELEGLKLLAKGYCNAEIAQKMTVSEATVKVYMGRLMQRFHVRNRVQLLIRASELGLVEPALD